MLIALIGESCTGKSTLADRLKNEFNAKIFTGKDYLRLSKSEAEAEKIFKNLLAEAVGGDNVIYVISETEHLRFLPEGCFRVLLTAELDTIKARFAARMRGNLPAPVSAMLERGHGRFDNIERDLHYKCDENYEALVSAVRGKYVN